MDQKLQSLFHSVSPRTAWITMGSCVALWVLCLSGVLTPPLSAPASITLFWFYAMLMLVLASGVAVIGAAAALLVRRRRAQESPESQESQESPESQDPVPHQDGHAGQGQQDGPDQLADLGRMLDDPGRGAR
ncbi:hypothetical protein J2M53_04955 [Arthrobacter sp. zg-ZUI100]|uniref:hypothetical protein n=1 Tax=Arthrobacter jiangjiafuii TaxID=2817475 RepID=UPI001AEE988E|nr:hypothetical protein [Arthrobacter jiangjiafuii]MBP3035606.1 hypothetical protein [Arthrobacter jiangjiafuii]